MDKFTAYLDAEHGRRSALARDLGLTPGAIYQWFGKVPPERVPEVERLTGIKRHDLRPDLWEPPRKKRA